MAVQKYSNDEITITWDSKICYHSEVCVKNLPEVFNIKNKPWVNVDGSSKEKIEELIGKCPSGALRFRLNNEENMTTESSDQKTKISCAKNGPLLVKGEIFLEDGDGNKIETSQNVALCRCGASTNKPFCDGSHKKIEFEG